MSRVAKRTVKNPFRCLAVRNDGYVGIGRVLSTATDKMLIEFEGINKQEWIPTTRCHPLVFTQLVNQIKEAEAQLSETVCYLKDKNRFLEKAKEREVPMDLKDFIVSFFSPTISESLPALQSVDYGDVLRYLVFMDERNSRFTRATIQESLLEEYVCFMADTALLFGRITATTASGVEVRVHWPLSEAESCLEVDRSFLIGDYPVILALHSVLVKNSPGYFTYPQNTVEDIRPALYSISEKDVQEYDHAVNMFSAMVR